MKANITGIRDVSGEQDEIRKPRIYNLQGQYLGTDFDVLPKGLYIVNGKKVVK